VSDTPPVLQIRDLHIEYRLGRAWVNAVREVNLTLAQGEIHGLVGESGSGKSTVALAALRYLAANARVAHGDIRFEGESLLAKSGDEMRRLWSTAMSLVPQDALGSLNPAYPVGEQIAEVFRMSEGLSGRDAHARAVAMLRDVRIADAERAARSYPHQLSGGMQQRVTIAMALSSRPRLLVLDEPTTALDVTTQAVVIDLFRALIRERAAAALYVSHDLGVVAQLCDRVTVLYAGEVMTTAPTRDLFRRPLHPYPISLLASLPRPTEAVNARLPSIEGVAPALGQRSAGCVFAARCPVALERCHHEKPPLEAAAPGVWVRCHRWPELAAGTLRIETEPKSAEPAPAAPPTRTHVLTADGISKTFPGGVHALSGASIAVRSQSTLGVVGESGSGKTTLARCIAALEMADSGALELLSIPLALDLKRRPHTALRELQMVFQNPNDSLNPYQTVGAMLARTLTTLRGRAAGGSRAAGDEVTRLLAAVRLSPEMADRYPAELSGGERQRVAIARAFAADPALVIADEPTSALDVSVQSAILNLLKDLRAGKGASYLFISHNLDAVAYLADWIVVMYLGEVVETGDMRQVYAPPSHPYTEALVSAIPVPDPDVPGHPIRLEGEPPSPRALPTGCRFHTRCPRKIGRICETTPPPVQDAGDHHMIRCHIPIDELTRLQTEALAQAGSMRESSR
jgi:peptide/nickel transport system ATP-binding protein